MRGMTNYATKAHPLPRRTLAIGMLTGVSSAMAWSHFGFRHPRPGPRVDGEYGDLGLRKVVARRKPCVPQDPIRDLQECHDRGAAPYNDFDIILTHITSFASTSAVTAVPYRVVYITLLDTQYVRLCCVQIGAHFRHPDHRAQGYVSLQLQAPIMAGAQLRPVRPVALHRARRWGATARRQRALPGRHGRDRGGPQRGKNDFDMILTISHVFFTSMPPHTRCVVYTLYLVPMLIGCWMVLAIRWCPRFASSGLCREQRRAVSAVLQHPRRLRRLLRRHLPPVRGFPEPVDTCHLPPFCSARSGLGG